MMLAEPVPDGQSCTRSSLKKLRVVLVDENEFLRAGLRAALWVFGVLVVGEAIDAEQAIGMVSTLSPAAVIMGQPAYRECGIEATRRLAATAPRTPVMLLAESTERDDLTAAIRAGARGYMLKDAPKEAIAGAVRAIAAGDSVVSSRIAGHLLDGIRNGTIDCNGGGEAESELLARLTDRELEALKLIAAGHENAEIAKALNISSSTAKKHTASILTKLHLDNRVQAAVFAVRCGLA